MTRLEGNPYVGPRAFQEHERDRFFGREREARDLLSLVISERLVLLYAQSGVGKSSLINTCLRPQLKAEGFILLPTGRVRGDLPPGIDKVENRFVFNLVHGLDQNPNGDPSYYKDMELTAFLARLATEDGEHYEYDESVISESPDDAYVEPPHALIIDQFEEIFTQHPQRWRDREGFFQQLDRALADDPLLWVVLSMREDYVARLDPYAPLMTGWLRDRYYMQQLGYAAALEAVQKPARLAGRPFAPKVAERLVDSFRQIRVRGQTGLGLGQFVEPVQLQIVCHQLWETVGAHEPGAGEITEEMLGGYDVDTALTQFYEAAIDKVARRGEVTEAELREWITEKLITERRTRHMVYRGELESAGLPTPAADALVDQYLLRTFERASATYYELVHDCFIEPILSEQARQQQRKTEVRALELQEELGKLAGQIFEITIQQKAGGAWPAVVRYQRGAGALTSWSRGTLALDLEAQESLLLAEKEYGIWLGRALFREDIRDAFVRAVAEAKIADQPLRVLLIVEADDLRHLHWELLCAPLRKDWDFLALDQQTKFSQYMPSMIGRRFSPIGRRDLRALILVAGPEQLNEDYVLASFDVAYTVQSIQQALGEIPCDVLASVDGAIGPPTLSALCEHLAAGNYTLLHLVCHGRYHQDSGETILYFPQDENGHPVLATDLIQGLSWLEHVPHFTFLSACESADPKAETGLGRLGQRLVREVGMPAVLAITDKVSIVTAQALASVFYARLGEHGEVDRALSEALAGLQGRLDVTVPAVFSRLGDRPLFSDVLDRPLSQAEIRYGLEQMQGLLKQRAPILLSEFEDTSARIRAILGAEAAELSAETRLERDAALAAVNQLCSEALDLSFNALALGQEPPDYDARCPFPGLSAFGIRFLAAGEAEQDDREFFFGREALIQRLEEKLAEHGFLPILGPSGSGKSSLVVAGLIPALQKVEPDLQMAYLTPGSRPLAQLEASRSKVEDKPAVLVVDQFEELFTLCEDEGERRAFLDRLLQLAGETRIVIAMRADFWGDCAPYPALRTEMQARQELIAPMDASELRAAMERQAAEVGLRFEADLSQTILDDVKGEPGAMPLLQHALLELWKRRHGRWLRAEEYRHGIGGVQKAIAHIADALYEALSSDDQKRMRDIFVRLTRLAEEAIQDAERQDTRQRVRLEELVPADGDPVPIRRLVQHLADARLVVTGPWEPPVEGQSLDDNPVEVEVAHEALIRYWPRLRLWLDEDRRSLRLRAGIGEAAKEWREHEEDEGFLVHRGARLDAAETLARDPKFPLSKLEQKYVDACTALRDRQRAAEEARRQRELRQARWLAVGAVGFSVVLIILAIFSWTQRQEAVAGREQATSALATAVLDRATSVAAEATSVAERARAEEQARISYIRELAALSLSQLDEHLDLAQLLSIEAFRAEQLLQARQALFQAWRHNPHLSHYLHGHGARVWSVKWSADGRLASGSYDGTIIIWDLERGLPAQTLEGYSDWITSVAWSADGRLASGSEDGTVIVWDLERNRPGQILKGHSSRVMSVAWSAEGRLASGSEDSTVIVWDLERSQPGQTLEGHDAQVMSVSWSAGGQLASGSNDNTVIIWDLERNEPGQILKGHSSGIRSVAWSVDGRLASSSEDQSVIVWDLETELPGQILGGHSGPVNSVAWSDEGQLASSSEDRTVIVWDLEREMPSRILEGHAAQVWSVTWSADGQLATGSEDNTVIIWNLAVDVPAQILKDQPAWVWSMAWSTDGQLASGLYDGTVVMWDLARGEPAQILEGHSGPVDSVAWSGDGRLASGSDDNSVIVWDLEHGLPAQTLEGHSDWVKSVAWSADGRLASGSYDGTIIIWDLERGLPAQTLEGYSDWITSVAWSADGRLASGSEDGTVIIWDLERGLPAQILAGHSGGVWGVAWSADGRLASASSDQTIIIWDLASGLPTQTLAGHSSWVKSVAWSMDGLLASGSEDRTVIIWDLESGLPAHTLTGHGAVHETVAWSADGQWLAMGSDDGMAQVWPMEPQMWIDQACERAGRNFTQAEWAVYFPIEEYRKTCEQWPAGE